MTTPAWEAGKLYQPGALVRPIRAISSESVAVGNGDFEGGDTGWTKGAGWVIGTNAKVFSGTRSAEFQGGTGGSSELLSGTVVDVTPGQTLTAKVKVNTGSNSVSQAGAAIGIVWLSATNTRLSVSEGNICRGGGDAWFESGVTARAPANAAKAQLRVNAYRNSGPHALWVDAASWDYRTAGAPPGLIYKAVQAAAGRSGDAEPAWPIVNGVEVVDNEVTWEAVTASRVVWEAEPILLSGGAEPEWPTTPGAFVSDGSISWEAISRRVEDEKCPQSKVVAIMAGKVFAADGDIVRFSATANPLDWSSADDAGYLPTGLQQANGNDMAVLAPYRSNLAAFNASSFQMWQVDPDPAAMALLDQMEGIGSVWPKAAQAVGDELFFLSALGVRTVGIAAGSTNLAAGDVGMPIDPMVRETLRVTVANGYRPVAAYYPGAGQYWLACNMPTVPTEGIALSGEFPDGVLGTFYSADALTVANAVAPLAWSASSLPAGLAISPETGVISGEPTAPGAITGDYAVVDYFGRSATATRAITINFGISIVANAENGATINSGATADYYPVQSLFYTGSTTFFSPNAEGTVFAARASATSVVVFERNEAGAFVEMPGALDTPFTNAACLQLSPDGQYLAIGRADVSAQLWLYKRVGNQFQKLADYTPTTDAIYHLAWSPSGDHLAVAENASSGPAIRVLARSGDTLTTLAAASSDTSNAAGVAWSRDGKRLVAQVRNHGLRVYTLNGTTLSQVMAGTIDEDYNGTGDQPAVVWSADGQYVYSLGSEAPAGIRLRIYQWSGVALSRMPDPPQALASPRMLDLSPDGRLLAVGDGTTVRIYEVDGADLTLVTGTNIAPFNGRFSFLGRP